MEKKSDYSDNLVEGATYDIIDIISTVGNANEMIKHKEAIIKRIKLLIREYDIWDQLG